MKEVISICNASSSEGLTWCFWWEKCILVPTLSQSKNSISAVESPKLKIPPYATSLIRSQKLPHSARKQAMQGELCSLWSEFPWGEKVTTKQSLELRLEVNQKEQGCDHYSQESTCEGYKPKKVVRQKSLSFPSGKAKSVLLLEIKASKEK